MTWPPVVTSFGLPFHVFHVFNVGLLMKFNHLVRYCLLLKGQGSVCNLTVKLTCDTACTATPTLTEPTAAVASGAAHC